MLKARKYVVIRKFVGYPKRDDFEIVEHELPEIKNGEILLKTEWISVDPYLRYKNGSLPLPYDQFGYQEGVVQDSKDPRFPVGTKVVSHKGWCDYSVVNSSAAGSSFLDKVYKLPTPKELSPSLGIGAVGMPGATAYFGLLKVCLPKPGETVAVTGAAGAVGSIVGQIAKIKGCKVIGFAGSDEKVKWLLENGFDQAFNYKTADVDLALKQAVPQGIDCYFDNVGGEISSVIMKHMNMGGRVSVCGSISVYNETEKASASIIQPAVIGKLLTVQGFQVGAWFDQWQEAFTDLTKWVASGQLKASEHVTEGFDNIYEAFVGMLKGDNIGKALVKV